MRGSDGHTVSACNYQRHDNSVTMYDKQGSVLRVETTTIPPSQGQAVADFIHVLGLPGNPLNYQRAWDHSRPIRDSGPV